MLTGFLESRQNPQAVIIGSTNPFFIMNNWLLVLAIILAAGISLALSYESVYNYSTYVVPIKNVNFLDDEPTAHIDSIKIGDENKEPIPIDKFEYIEEDNSLTIYFIGGPNGPYPAIPDFNYQQNLQKNQTLVFRCVEDEDFSYLGFYKFLGVDIIDDEAYILLWHFDGETNNRMPCNYPEVISNSIDLVDDHPTDDDIKKKFSIKLRE